MKTNPPRAIAFLAFLFFGGVAAAAPTWKPQYNRDVRPILADKCFPCHGPDAAARQADMRLDQRSAATLDRGGYRVIAAGLPNASELMRRIVSTDHAVRMPPPESVAALRPEQIAVLRQWIEEGAAYQPHWSFLPPRRPALPRVQDHRWPTSPIDRFVLARLQDAGLEPSDVADPATLIRRVTLDLTGLPPTLDEIDAFEHAASRSPRSAHHELVNRLLASPRFGERMALPWLDAARYADTNGYFTDNDRTMWPWRDWVIGALNNNMPFDQFTIEQLAGDLLPDATIDQKIATGFNRNHMVNNETGIIEEEFRVEYVVDRVDTTATVWMGLTLACARCHDHKFDPISQQEFYQFFSFFNNVPERGLSGSSGNAAPLLKVPAAAQQRQLDQLRRDLANAERTFASRRSELDAAQAAWERTAIERLPPAVNRGLVAHYALDDETTRAVSAGAVRFVEGMLGNAAKFAGDAAVRSTDGFAFERDAAFSLAAWIQPAAAGCIVSKMDDAHDMRGLDVTLRKGKAIVNLVHRWNRDAIRVSTTASVPMRQWQHLMVTYDGSGKAAGVRIYLDGRRQAVVAEQDNLTGTIGNDQPLRIGRRQASASFQGLVDDVRIYNRPLTGDEVPRLVTGQLIRGVLARSTEQRSATQQRKLRDVFLEHHADPSLATAASRLEKLRAASSALAQEMPTTMVMRETEPPRRTFLLVRGQYDQPGAEVTAGLPKFLSPPESDAPSHAGDGSPSRAPNRLDLARWLVDPAHPLTARVTVNRLWQQLFGTGIVKTVDDFGTQGDWPSHPDLLDWLATELVASGWDMKHLVRLIVTSATYRQSSRFSSRGESVDPENRLLARGPRIRLDAEMLRDNALAISGLLVERLGGPSVNPYQPGNLWKEVTYDSDRAYRPGAGAALYRRGLYTFWKRQSPPPAMLVFDAPTRETCIVQRSRTNTPLQALALMNDPTFVEAARKLAEKMMTVTGGREQAVTAAERIIHAFRSATARRPTTEEVQVLWQVFRQQRETFQRNPHDAVALLHVGEATPDESLDPAELAAWTTVASMILSLDETITRP